jgi:hypothetical protein
LRNYSKGSITYFKNTGTRESPEFTKVTDSLGRVDVINREWSVNGYSKPHFFRDNTGNMHLFCGNEDGKILHYIDIEENLFDGGEFRRLNDVETLHATSLQTISEGSFTAVTVADFNKDGILDMVVGNHRGGLTIFFGIEKDPVKNKPVVVETDNYPSLRIYPNPVTNGQLTIEHGQLKFGDRIEIFDINGKRVHVERLPDTHHPTSVTINISHLPDGIYILKIGNQTVKFVKNQ